MHNTWKMSVTPTLLRVSTYNLMSNTLHRTSRATGLDKTHYYRSQIVGKSNNVSYSKI